MRYVRYICRQWDIGYIDIDNELQLQPQLQLQRSAFCFAGFGLCQLSTPPDTCHLPLTRSTCHVPLYLGETANHIAPAAIN
jgi:hypothetical protein